MELADVESEAALLAEKAGYIYIYKMHQNAHQLSISGFELGGRIGYDESCVKCQLASIERLTCTSKNLASSTLHAEPPPLSERA